MSLNTFEWIYKLQFLDKSNKLHRMHGFFDWLLQYIKCIKLIVHLCYFFAGDITMYSFIFNEH